MTADTRDMYDLAIGSVDRDKRILALTSKHVARLDGELAELRDELLALSTRIEAVTRAVGGGLHSVKVTL